MTRSFFIKNIFGAVVGVALLPTAIMNTSTLIDDDTIAPKPYVLPDISKFRVGDIVRIDGKNQYLIVSANNVSKDFPIYTAYNIVDRNDKISLHHSTFQHHNIERLFNTEME